MSKNLAVNKQPSEIMDLFRKSVALVRERYRLFLIVNSVPLALTIGQYFSPVRFDRELGLVDAAGKQITGSSITTFFVVGFMLLFTLTLSALLNTFLVTQTAQDKQPGFADIWEPVKSYGGGLFALYLAMGFIFLFGFLALIIPGLIFLRRYFLAPYVMADQKCTVREALSKSAALTKPYSSSVWWLIGGMVVVSFVGSFGLISSVLSSVLSIGISVAPALLYFELKRLSQGSQQS